MKTHQRILIIKPSSLGDVSNSLPLLCDLRAALPDAQIDWLVHPAFLPIIQGHDALHEAILFERKKLAPWWYKPAAFKQFRTLIKKLRSTHYDVVIDGQGLLRTGFFSRMTGSPIRIGWAHGGEGSTLAYTHKVAVPDKGRSTPSVDRMRALGTPLGTDMSKPAQFRLPLQPAAVTKAESLIAQNPALSDEPFVAVCPGARWETKRWPMERFVELVLRMLEAGEHILLLGSPDEKPLCDQIEAQIKNQKSRAENLVNLAGQTDLATMIALLSRSKLIIGHDSGPAHLAAALNKPVVGIYGPTAPNYAAPYGRIDQVVRHDVPCHPCRRRTCSHHSCMQGLTVELVWEKTRQTLLR